MLSSEQILEEAARDGSIDIAEWPRVLENVLQRLHDIVHTSFPLPPPPQPHSTPQVDPSVVASTPPHASSSSTTRPPDSDLSLPDASDDTPEDNIPPDSSQNSTKENDAPLSPSPTTVPSKPPVPKFSDSAPTLPQQEREGNAEVELAGALPPECLSSYQASARLLERDFGRSPPYTIQRLAELVLYPRKHYRFLPAYLRALDRVVCVSSPVSEFPLQSGPGHANGELITNGDVQERDGLGSDESLGGALLTPIPWLRQNGGSGNGNGDGELHSESTETILGPNGAGSIETVSVTVNGVSSSSTGPAQTSPNTSTPASPTLSEQSDASTGSSTTSTTDAQLREQGGVTQGELLRQEQEAGVVPVAQTAPRRSLLASGAVAVGREHEGVMEADVENEVDAMNERPEEHPHARGPEVIGMEDMGPQGPGFGVGGAAGLNMEAAVGRGGESVAPAPQAEKAAEEAEKDQAGAEAKGPRDVEMEESMSQEQERDMKEREGEQKGIVVADADGMTGVEREQAEEKGEGPGPSAVDTTGL